MPPTLQALLYRLVGGHAVQSGSITALNGTVELTVEEFPTHAVGIRIGGTFTATLVGEASINGTDWFSTDLFDFGSEQVLTSVAAAGNYRMPRVGGVKAVRVRASAFTSGSVTVSMRGTPGSASDDQMSPWFESVGNAGTVTAPGAGAAIVTIASGSLPRGLYEVMTYTGYGGTADVINNMELRKGATVISDLYVIAAANTAPVPTRFWVELDGTQALSVNAIAAGGAGSVFNAMLVASRVMSYVH